MLVPQVLPGGQASVQGSKLREKQRMSPDQSHASRPRMIALLTLNLVMYTGAGIVSDYFPRTKITDIVAISLLAVGVAASVWLIFTIRQSRIRQ